MGFKNHYVVIMAGGFGARLWPYSRTHFPKQFHDILHTGQTLIQQTVERFVNICPIENIFIVTNRDYEDLVSQQLPLIPKNQILLEPFKRNTAACIAYASFKIYNKDPKANIIVAPSDQVIFQEEKFISTLQRALKSTNTKDRLVTLGIKPSRPDTGYGYIQFFEEKGPLKKVKHFVEKPERLMAEKFLESGDFVWNAGIFIWNVQTILSAFQKYLPEIYEAFDEVKYIFETEQESEAIEKVYFQCKNVSIDYGIMEKADNVYVILSDFGWQDLGTWNALYEVSTKDSNQNVVQGDHLIYDTHGCIIKMPKDKLVVIQGLENFIIAEYDNVLIICPKDQEQKVRDFVADAKNLNKDYV